MSFNHSDAVCQSKLPLKLKQTNKPRNVSDDYSLNLCITGQVGRSERQFRRYIQTSQPDDIGQFVEMFIQLQQQLSNRGVRYVFYQSIISK